LLCFAEADDGRCVEADDDFAADTRGVLVVWDRAPGKRAAATDDAPTPPSASQPVASQDGQTQLTSFVAFRRA